ncbi:MAG: hypothetical protein CMI56_02420 [Parcubacteria group bacterium]|nr:hypothetical protein [Parcubacteria group bacterium]|tara:strand:+ start:1523 stop:1957 length:435 start_codon:yes stop_codon:yes gene_type:complete
MKYHFDRTYAHRILQLVAAPFIFSMIIPIVILDVFLEIYHQVTFRLLSIPRIPRGDYVRIDRHKLSYLRPAQKVFCAYCGYANGLLHYAVRIAAESEKYWCGIMHKMNKNDSFIVPEHHKDFIEYGDEKTYRAELERAKSEAKK